MPEFYRIGAGVDEAAQCHVTRDAEKQWNQATRPPARALLMLPPLSGGLSVAPVILAGHRSNLAAAHAAPKPLSIPTTVMPAAQDASIASSAVTPSSDAP